MLNVHLVNEMYMQKKNPRHLGERLAGIHQSVAIKFLSQAAAFISERDLGALTVGVACPVSSS